MTDYRIITEIDRAQWSDFVYRHPRGNIFQTPEMFDVFANTGGYEPLAAAAADDRGNIAGIVSAVVQKENPGVTGRLSARSIIWGGPLVKDDDPAVLDTLLNGYDRLIAPRAIYSQYRNLWDQEKTKTVFAHARYEYEEHLDILVDLNKSEKELWKEVNPRGRNKIRRAQKEGTAFKDLTGKINVMAFYDILDDVYRKAKLPLPGVSLFRSAADVLLEKKMIRFFAAVNNNKVIGTLIALCYKDTIYDWYAGSYREFYNKYPNDILPWNVFLWGKENGYTLFDFGGAGKPGEPYGVRDYKKKFGGTFVNFGRYEKIHKPILMKIARTGFRVWQKVKF